MIRAVCAQDVYVLADCVRNHSVEHAKEILEQYLYRESYHDLNKAAGPRKPLLAQGDVEVMQGPRLEANQQIMEFLEIPVKPVSACFVKQSTGGSIAKHPR